MSKKDAYKYPYSWPGHQIARVEKEVTVWIFSIPTKALSKTFEYFYGRTSAMFYFLYPSPLHRYLGNQQGKSSWALVTGASDGIGEGFAHELCSHGFNVGAMSKRSHASKTLSVQSIRRARFALSSQMQETLPLQPK
jgi:hypothetical protein